MSEFSIEPIPGLPERPPEGETILWQGKPNAWSLARHALHVRKIGLYFVLIGLWLGLDALAAGAHVVEASGQLLSQLAIGASAILLLSLFAWLVQRTTIYTLTNRRIVIRFGVALPITVNLPFNRVDSADLRLHQGGRGDISLSLNPKQPVSYLLFWPHVRPWHFRNPQPMLRCIDGVEEVAGLLGNALAAHQEQTSAVERTEPGATADRRRYTTETRFGGAMASGEAH